MDLRSSSITADILNFLSDGKLHTYDEIAETVEVSKSTVRRHIQSLSYRYPIETFHGGERKGVQLDKNYMPEGKILTKEKIMVLNKALELLQSTRCDGVDPKTVAELLKEFKLPKEVK